MKSLRSLTEVIRAAKTVEVASGIIPIGVYDAGEMKDLYADIEKSDPDE